MNQGLKRIEATLHQLATQDADKFGSGDSLTVPVEPQRTAPQTAFDDSLPLLRTTLHPTSPTASKAATENLPSEPAAVQQFSLEPDHLKAPALPKFKSPSFSSHRNGANPALATNILQEIQTIVAGWQAELKTVLRQIQDLYLEGPIVDGWLESHSRTPGGLASELRHTEISRLMDYVEEICTPSSSPQPSGQAAPTGYRLCGLNADGQLWSRPCPPEQVASVSMAIARYHKLRQLLSRKQDLETRLSQLAELLVMVHGQLKA